MAERTENIMAWISVHDTIDGPKLRDLCSLLNCTKAQAKGILQALWMWGLNNAGKDGLILKADKYDIESVMSIEIDSGRADRNEADSITDNLIRYGLCREEDRQKVLFQVTETIKQFRPTPETAVDALIQAHWIDEDAGELYLHDWDRWQKEWYKYKSRLESDAERKRRGKQSSDEADTDETPPDEETEKPKKRKRIDYPDDFLEFYAAYPRQDRKQEAYHAFNARKKEGISAEEMIAAAKSYAAKIHREHTAENFTMQPNTFVGPNYRFKKYVPKNPVRVYDEASENPFDRFVEE